jgi:hypothetical protein
MQLVYLGWEALALTAAFIGVIGALLLYMLSRIFNLPQLEQQAKTELIFAASTVLMVASVVLLIDEGEPAIVDIAKKMYAATFGLELTDEDMLQLPESYTLIDITKLYMDPVVNCGKAMLKGLYGISIPVEAMASVYMEIFMSEHASGFGLKFISERIKNMTELITFYVFAYYLITHILNFIKHYWSLFFTIGVVCRAFPLTRGAGAYLMAISLGLYFVFPFAYILSGSVISMFVKSDYYDAQNRVCLVPAVVEGTTLCQVGADFTTVLDAKRELDARADELVTFWEVATPSILRHLTAVICVLPFVTMIITLSFILSSTNLFGGMVPEIGRGLIKLI